MLASIEKWMMTGYPMELLECGIILEIRTMKSKHDLMLYVK